MYEQVSECQLGIGLCPLHGYDRLWTVYVMLTTFVTLFIMFIRAGLLRSRQLWNSFGDACNSCESEYKGNATSISLQV